MEEKCLGKITRAEFGQDSDRPFMFGLQLTFEGKGWGIGDGGINTYNLNDTPWINNYGSKQEKLETIEEQILFLDKILKDAKVNTVSELKGKPVEVTISDHCFKDFRILTEVI